MNVKWVIKAFLNHYWNHDDGWITYKDNASKFDSEEDAEIELAINPNIDIHSNGIYEIEKIYIKDRFK